MFVFILIVIACFQHASSESCYFQRCLGCRAENTYYTGTPIECNPGTWVTAEWVHNLGHPPPSTASKLPTEMRCLKMVATPDDTTLGRTVDVLKGCVPRAQVDSVCLALVAVERARGHSDARCFVCRGNNCNPAWSLKSTIVTTLPSVTLILYYVLK